MGRTVYELNLWVAEKGEEQIDVLALEAVVFPEHWSWR